MARPLEVFDIVRREVKNSYSDPKQVKDYSRFYKDDKPHISLTHPVMDRIARENFAAVNGLEKKDVFRICERLLKERDVAMRNVAFNWAYRVRGQFEEGDFTRFENWLKRYVDSWDSCDDFCARALGVLVERFPACLPRVKAWTASANLWLRRASAVVLIYSLRRGKYFKEAITVATKLLADKEDMVQKGYGWMLKEMSRTNGQAVFDFVMKKKHAMPRTALRYAIEKMPEGRRRKLMA
jgi:3-methyladenine DNA glycosylase AlkD